MVTGQALTEVANANAGKRALFFISPRKFPAVSSTPAVQRDSTAPDLQVWIVQFGRAPGRFRYLACQFRQRVDSAELGLRHEVEHDVFVLLFAFEPGPVLDIGVG